MATKEPNDAVTSSHVGQNIALVSTYNNAQVNTRYATAWMTKEDHALGIPRQYKHIIYA